MKIFYPVLPVLMFLSGFAILFASETDKREERVFRLRPTHEELAKRQAEVKARQEQNGVVPRVAKPSEKRKSPGSSSLIARSAVLSSNHSWTIVPKGAVLHVPDRFKTQVNGKRNGKLVPWKTFFAQNRGWIHVHSVSMKEARGEKKMDPDKVKVYQGLGRVVVSVCHGGPISIVAPKKEDPEDPPKEPGAQPVIK